MIEGENEPISISQNQQAISISQTQEAVSISQTQDASAALEPALLLEDGNYFLTEDDVRLLLV